MENINLKNYFEIEGKIINIKILEKVGYVKLTIPALSKKGKNINKFVSLPFFDELKDLLKNYQEGSDVVITGEIIGGYSKTYPAARTISPVKE